MLGGVMQLHVLRSRQLLQSPRVGHHLVDHHIAGSKGLGLLGFVGFIKLPFRVLLARCPATRIRAEVPLIALASFYRYTGLRLRVGIAMDHRTCRIL